MIDLAAAVARLADKVTTLVGLPATVDPRNVQAPCVLIGGPDFDRLSVDGCAAALTVPVTLLAPPPDNADAQAILNAHAVQVALAVGASSATRGTYTIGGTDLPCYLYLVTFSAKG